MFQVVLNRFAGSDYSWEITEMVKEVFLPKVSSGRPAPTQNPNILKLIVTEDMHQSIMNQIEVQREAITQFKGADAYKFDVVVNIHIENVTTPSSYVMGGCFIKEYQAEFGRLNISCDTVKVSQ